MDIDAAFNINSIQLEPRLQEYLRRKRFNEENDIDPPIPEEQEFCITNHDLKIIKKYKQGKTNLYSSKRLAKNPNFIVPEPMEFKTVDFKKDPDTKDYKRKCNPIKMLRNRSGTLKILMMI